MTGFRQPKNELEMLTGSASITLSAADAGKQISNLGATGTVTITFPSAATMQLGDSIRVLSCADQTLTCAFTAGQLIALNNAAATSVSLQTSSELIGGGFIFTVVSGAKWHCLYLTNETQTVTIA